MPLRVSKLYRAAILHYLRSGKPRFQRLLLGTRMRRKLARELLSKTVCLVQDWDVYEVQLPRRIERTRHVVGTLNHANDMRVSSAVASIDSVLREASTEIGEKFNLGGRVQGGVDVDTYFAWWRDINGATDVVRVTAEIKSMLSSWEKK